MAWDPTDKETWKRALEPSGCSPRHSPRAKKARLPTESNEEPSLKEQPAVESTDCAENAFPVDPAINSEKWEDQNCLMTPNTFAAPYKQNDFVGSFEPDDLQDLNECYRPFSTAYPLIHTSTEGDSATGHGKGIFSHSLRQSMLWTSATEARGQDSVNALLGDNSNSLPNPEGTDGNVATSMTNIAILPEFLTPMRNAPLSISADGSVVTSAFVSPQTLTPTPIRQSYLFTDEPPDALRGRNPEYLEKIKSNAYTRSILPQKPSEDIETPLNSYQARTLLKKGRYQKPRGSAASKFTVEDLQPILHHLRERHAELKAKSDAAGIQISEQAWKNTNAIVEEQRPSLKDFLASAEEKDLQRFQEQIVAWDQAVGHKTILMKRLLYKQQVHEVEKTITEIQRKAVEDSGKNAENETTEEAKEPEWKGHKTKKGRRFKGLIEKD